MMTSKRRRWDGLRRLIVAVALGLVVAAEGVRAVRVWECVRKVHKMDLGNVPIYDLPYVTPTDGVPIAVGRTVVVTDPAQIRCADTSGQRIVGTDIEFADCFFQTCFAGYDAVPLPEDADEYFALTNEALRRPILPWYRLVALSGRAFEEYQAVLELKRHASCVYFMVYDHEHLRAFVRGIDRVEDGRATLFCAATVSRPEGVLIIRYAFHRHESLAAIRDELAAWLSRTYINAPDLPVYWDAHALVTIDDVIEQYGLPACE